MKLKVNKMKKSFDKKNYSITRGHISITSKKIELLDKPLLKCLILKNSIQNFLNSLSNYESNII